MFWLQYGTIFSRESLKMFRTDWLILRVTHQPFEIESSKISFLRGRGTSIINEIKRIE